MGDELGRKALAKVVGDQDAVMGDRLWRSAWNTSWEIPISFGLAFKFRNEVKRYH